MQSSKARIMESLRETPETILAPSDDTISRLHGQDPSSSTTSPSRPKPGSHRFALLSPPSDYDLRSLPPTPQESSPDPPYLGARLPSRSRTDKPHPPTPPTISPKTPLSPAGSFAFPTTQQRRKLSTASQQSGAFARTSVASTLSYSSSGGLSSSSMPPNIPVRSPLRRPAAKSTASFTGVLKEYDLAPDSPLPITPNPYTDGSPDPNASLASQLAASRAPSRALPLRPSDVAEIYSGALCDPRSNNSNPSLTSFAATITPASPFGSASTSSSHGTGTTPGPSASKRQHALLELLSSERAYAADLAVVRDIHIPLSRGQPPPFEVPATAHHLSIPSSPRSSTHTTSTASSTQTTSTAASSVGPMLSGELPMTLEASKIIFGNIDEIAVFADRFGEKLEAAMGTALTDDAGDDRVGELFLEMIPVIAPLYKTYITRHPTALAQFQSLPPSPALTNYISTTRVLTTSHTHAWDIPSLLIKPVQRLLKYPLLLNTIYADTAEDHPDKATLLEAKDRIEEVARMVNEGRRRWEVVKTVLGQSQPRSDSNGSGPTGTGPKGLAAPKMSRMKSFRTKVKAGIVDAQDLDQGRRELELWEKRIKECEMVTKDFARLALEWNKEIKISLKKLKGWNNAFGEVVGLGEQGVEAVGAFGKVVSGLLTLEKELDVMINSTLLQQLSSLLKTLSSPRILLTHMHTLRHSHVTLLNTPYHKSRPPSALIEASNDYLALQATLREELPAYIQLFEKGLGVILLEFSKWQKGYWRELRDRWISFWVALAAEGEGNEAGAIAGIGSGAEETVKIWWERFEELDGIINGLEITTKRGANRHLRPVDQTPPDPLYQQRNSSATSVQELGGKDVYQRSMHSRSAQELLTEPKWGDSPRTSGHSTPSLRGRHRRNASDTSEIVPLPPTPPLIIPQQSVQQARNGHSHSELAHMMSSFSLQEDLVESPLPLLPIHNQLDPPPSPLYSCATLVAFLPPSHVVYMNLPFLTLHVGDTIQVLYEAGHPSEHSLPIYVDEGDDCLLVARDELGRVGWAFASFVMPLVS
ncbi:hypothetical protein FRB97_000921 [Tulasnella sp. 331]|nr:hypothetical protein FRB97_000921 [Tulasnella sp. 331]